eukprot:431549-Amphidinium_carterae.1
MPSASRPRGKASLGGAVSLGGASRLWTDAPPRELTDGCRGRQCRLPITGPPEYALCCCGG